jgi:hypothetical protein
MNEHINRADRIRDNMQETEIDFCMLDIGKPEQRDERQIQQ